MFHHLSQFSDTQALHHSHQNLGASLVPRPTESKEAPYDYRGKRVSPILPTPHFHHIYTEGYCIQSVPLQVRSATYQRSNRLLLNRLLDCIFSLTTTTSWHLTRLGERRNKSGHMAGENLVKSVISVIAGVVYIRVVPFLLDGISPNRS